ncbi:MAG TPA: phosphoenolpyruvate-protein phosphotransferase PtsP [Gammaproteobacteria bacterium]|nr:phosphoenolpyruvate--protein phosphotransferase [Gammaproteobacteria bacterium]HCG69198.1 phosphoenolpyruvate-protein phosphotransferase PtsP [Gammaproteobacteria bacterium]
MLNMLRKIVQDVTQEGNFAVSVQRLAAHIKDALGTEVCSIYLTATADTGYVLAATDGLNASRIGEVLLAQDQGLVGLVGRRAEPLNLEAAPSHPNFYFVPEIGEEPFNAFLGVPILHQGRVLGVLVVQQREPRRFDESEEAFLVTLSAQLATTVAHAEALGSSIVAGVSADLITNGQFKGFAGAPGIGIGTGVVMHPIADLDAVPSRPAEDITIELMLLDRAIEAVRNDIRSLMQSLQASLPQEELALFDAYLHMLDDGALAGDIREVVRRGEWAQGALRKVIRQHVGRFEIMDDPYLRERGTDVKDLGVRVLAYLQRIREKKTQFPDDAILVGEEITPAMLGAIPAEQLRGVVSLRGSGNSHVAILARAMGVPAVMGALDLPAYELEGAVVIVDGHYGDVYTQPSEERLRENQSLLQQEQVFAAELDDLKELPCVTLDGWRVQLWVNIGLTSDITRSLDRGAEGIGLFRTEVPFMSQDRFPTEVEQRALYREHMEAFDPRPVTMRTLDIGGDKSLSYFPIQEENPFLGWRGIRVTLDHPEIFLVQVRAMLKANADLLCDLRIMLPMISSLTELRRAKQLIDQAYAEVLEEGVQVKRPQVGVLIEVPAAVYQARLLAREADFIAVGSNDLTQYLLAVDRNNPRVAELYQEIHPAVVTALREVARAVHAEEKPLGICGELAGTPAGAMLLMAMGYHVLSMNATHLLRVKWVIRSIKRSDARRMLARVMRMHTAEEVTPFLNQEMLRLGLGKVMPARLGSKADKPH